MSKPFVNLHNHSHYSLQQSLGSPQRIIERARELAQPAVALTDTGNIHGLLELYKFAKKYEDIKPIFGAEICFTHGSRWEQSGETSRQDGVLVFLVKNNEGYKNLMNLVTLANIEGYFNMPRVDFELLEEYKEGLFVLMGDSQNGVLSRTYNILGEASTKALFTKLQNIFGKENTFLELVASQKENQIQWNKQQVRLFPDASFVATGNSRYISIEDREAFEVILSLRHSVLVQNLVDLKIDMDCVFKSWDNIASELQYIDEVVLEKSRKNTVSIAESIRTTIDFETLHLPAFETDDPDLFLRQQCEKYLPKFFRENFSEAKKRLDYELSVIARMGFSSYFLIVADIIAFAKSREISVGPGRGSAAGSIVSYILGITTIDPIEYELIFERFLNPERISMPDIDIDFSDERREEVFEYVKQKYGESHVSQVCTFGTMAAKAALKDVGRVYGIPFADMNKFTQLIPNRPGIKLEEIEKISEVQTYLKTNPQLPQVFRIAQKLEGCIRHLSVHACATIIADKDLSHYTALQWVGGDNTQAKVTQYPYQQLEEIGLLKMDFLGLKNLSVIERTVKNIRSQGQNIDLAHIPIDDIKTFHMMSEGLTMGVFQFESAGMRRYLKELQPNQFEDLVAMNALYRPGPMEYIPDYIKGKNNPKSVKYLSDDLKKVLEKTYGIAVYQEQVLKIAQIFAGFSLGEADLLRKAIGKKIPEILQQQRENFIKGAAKKNYAQSVSEKIFDDIIIPFSGYGFNRSHAVCYARIAYETAYLKASYPLEFMSAMMTTDRNNTDRIVLEMQECQAMGISVLPPSVLSSNNDFTMVEGGIRFGMSAIKGIGSDTVDQIIQERDDGGYFKNILDFFKRIPVKFLNKKVVEALIFSGALDELCDRKKVFLNFNRLIQFGRDHQSKSSMGQSGLFGETDDIPFVFASGGSEVDMLKKERDTLGIFVSDHPLRGMEGYFQKHYTPIAQLKEGDTDADDHSQDHDDASIENQKKSAKISQNIKIIGIITSTKKILTKKGQNMMILEIEDMTSKIEVCLFPHVYEKLNNRDLLVEDALVIIKGSSEDRRDRQNVIAQEVEISDLIEQKKKAIDAQLYKGDIMDQEIQKHTSIFSFVIPTHMKKSCLTDIKNILHESRNNKGEKIKIILGDKEIILPYRVHLNSQQKQEILNIISSNDELDLKNTPLVSHAHLERDAESGIVYEFSI